MVCTFCNFNIFSLCFDIYINYSLLNFPIPKSSNPLTERTHIKSFNTTFKTQFKNCTRNEQSHSKLLMAAYIDIYVRRYLEAENLQMQYVLNAQSLKRKNPSQEPQHQTPLEFQTVNKTQNSL